MQKRKILIDFDGVINDYDGNYDEKILPKKKIGVEKFLNTLILLNFELYIFTSRNLLKVSKWLIKNKLDEYFFDITNNKIPAYLYIDDRTICFNGDYNKLLDDIKNFKIYWENK